MNLEQEPNQENLDTSEIDTQLARLESAIEEISSIAERTLERGGQIDLPADLRGKLLSVIDKSFIDEATGLRNKEYLHEVVAREFREKMELTRPDSEQRKKPEVSVIFLDLERFKSINDTYGHLAGDAAIKAVADVLKGQMRPGDTIVRNGGDEFVVVLDVEKDVAEEKAKEIQRAIGKLEIEYEDATFTVGVSVGVASLDEDNNDFNTILAKADKAMYRNKEERKEASGSDGR